MANTAISRIKDWKRNRRSHQFKFVLLSQFALIAIYPLAGASEGTLPGAFGILAMLVFLAGLYQVAEERHVRTLAVVLGLLGVTANVFVIFGYYGPLLIPAGLVAAITWTKIVLSDNGEILWSIAGVHRARFSASDVVRYDDGYLVMGAARGLGAGKAFIVRYRTDGKEKELRFSAKLYGTADIQRLKKFIDDHRNS